MTKISNWFKNLFCGYAIGIEDLFLASWKKVVALVLLFLLPIIYGVSMSIAYWNPSDNLNRVPLTILNADYEFIEVVQVEQDQTGAYDYRIGALMEGDHVLGSKPDDQLAKTLLAIKQGEVLGPLVLNTQLANGKQLELTYNQANTFLIPVNAWDLFKSSLHKKTQQTTDNGAQFELLIAPNDSLKFKKITYYDDSSKIDQIWQTNKFQGQMKIDFDYGANLVKNIGQVLNKDGASISNKNQPQVEVFTTFQRNFIVGYLLYTFSNFKDLLVQGVSPYVNALYQNDVSMKLFGTPGELLKTGQRGNSYLVSNQAALKEPDKGATLFGDSNNGLIQQWLVNLLGLNDYLNKLDLINQNTSYFAQFMNDLLRKAYPKDDLQGLASKGALAFKQMLTTDQPFKEAEGKALLDAYRELLFIDSTSPIKWMPLFRENQSVLLQTSTNNLNTWFTQQMLANPTYFHNLTLPYLLGNSYQAIQTQLNLKGWDPTEKISINNNNINSKGTATVYGIGFGGMFVIIGLFIATTMTRGIVSRQKQYGKLNFASWYLSKYLIYQTIGFLQVTFTTWIVYATSWHQLVTPDVMALDWLWFLAADTVIISLLLGFQYFFSSPLLGAIAAILYFMLNVSSGGGSYPGFLQVGFYRAIQPLLVFTYIFQGLDEINFGINILGFNHPSSQYILQQWAMLAAFFAFFFFLGFVASFWRIRQATYGSYRGGHVYQGLISLNRKNLAKKFYELIDDPKTQKSKVKYHWEVLPSSFDPKLYFMVKKCERDQSGFKWYKKKRAKLQAEEGMFQGSDD